MSNSAEVVLKKMMEAGYSEAMAKTLGTAQFPTAKSDFLPWFPWFINVYPCLSSFSHSNFHGVSALLRQTHIH